MHLSTLNRIMSQLPGILDKYNISQLLLESATIQNGCEHVSDEICTHFYVRVGSVFMSPGDAYRIEFTRGGEFNAIHQQVWTDNRRTFTNIT